MTLALPFALEPAEEWDELFAPSVPHLLLARSQDPDGLAYYQREAVNATFDKMSEGYQSILMVMATGLGKTQTFCVIAKEFVKRFSGSALILAHRKELVFQARDRLEQMTGQLVEVEMAGWTASDAATFVVGSVASFNKNRLGRLGKDRFQLVIVDEAHHAPANTFKRAIRWFENAKVIGATATTDRLDEKALGQIFDTVSCCVDILQGIEAGYLVPVDGKEEIIEEIQLDGVLIDKKTKDLAEGQLDEAMLKAAEGIVLKVLERFPNRAALVFAPGVKTAEYMHEKFNLLAPGSSIFIHAKTPPDDRDRMVRDFKAGKHLYFVNVGIATEGFDAPDVSMVVMARPTTSRALYAQMAGRALRAPKAVFVIEGKDAAGERKDLIERSFKPRALILDFVGNRTKHNLCTAEDLLGGDFSEEEVALAKKLKKEKGTDDPRANLKAARERLRAIAAATKANIRSTIRDFDPFAAYSIDLADEQRYAVRFGHKPASLGQITALERMGLRPEEMHDLTYKAAKKLLEEWNVRRKAGMASFKQIMRLKHLGVDARQAKFDNASKAISYLDRTGRGRHTDVKKLEAILFATREPGED